MDCLGLEEEEDIHGGGGWRWSGHSVPDRLKDGIYAHALHPEGRAFFVSSRLFCYVDRAVSYDTFSYDTERGEWTHHGDWKLPFQGQAH